MVWSNHGRLYCSCWHTCYNQMSGQVIKGSRKHYLLQIDATTSTLEDHNSFDYEMTVQELSLTTSSRHQLPLQPLFIHIYRSRNSNQKSTTALQLLFAERENLAVGEVLEECEHLGAFQIRYVNKNIILRFYEVEDLMHHNKYGPINKENIRNKQNHQMYVIVRSIKDQSQESIGWRLSQGSFLKIGQRQYFVSSVCRDNESSKANIHQKIMMVDKIINSQQPLIIQDSRKEGECKYCMMEEGQAEDQFLCSPCKCSGSCALVHFACLEKWNQAKVKKNKIKGLTYYNFQKFFCEVCKEEYPKFIEKGNKVFELMPIEFPKGQHLILEEVEVKNSSMICIEDIPAEGIRMGRGHECEIRVDNPSISRNHARIIKKHGDYYVFDNKSKFGTLIKDSKLYLELDMSKKGVQIDRTVLMFSIVKKNA